MVGGLITSKSRSREQYIRQLTYRLSKATSAATMPRTDGHRLRFTEYAYLAVADDNVTQFQP